ncbi:MAG TPA: hypothetical protein VMM77_00255 [Gemmatimonadaceae bacterium]|nr:hypothetical protein [Gemmatimonadaceae bacterium]
MPRRSLTLEPHEFPFPALAAYSAVATPGREREIAMACLLAARLVAGTLPPLTLAAAPRLARATGAQAWLASHQMSARLRTGFSRLFDATAAAPPLALARPLRAVLEMAGPRLDDASRAELGALLERIT